MFSTTWVVLILYRREYHSKAHSILQHKELANKFLDETKMGYLVIGDAATQFDRFKNAGFDEVKLLDKDAKEVKLESIKM